VTRLPAAFYPLAYAPRGRVTLHSASAAPATLASSPYLRVESCCSMWSRCPASMDPTLTVAREHPRREAPVYGVHGAVNGQAVAPFPARYSPGRLFTDPRAADDGARGGHVLRVRASAGASRRPGLGWAARAREPRPRAPHRGASAGHAPARGRTGLAG